MTCAAATFPGGSAFDCRASALADCRRAIGRGIVIGLGSLSVAGVVAGVVTATAASIIALALGTAPHLTARAPLALQTALVSEPDGRLVGTLIAGLAPVFAPSADAPHSTIGAEPMAAAVPNHAPSRTSRLALVSAQADDAPLPPRFPMESLQSQAPHDTAGAPARPALPPIAAAPRPAAPPTFVSLLQKPSAPQQASDHALALPVADGRTAIYDIEAHTVYMPNGLRLEAHSGLGPNLDDPRAVAEKDRGPTPPNVYDLVLRGELFHGVQAIRLNPAGDSKMFGRDGILAHPYMLGPTGQSFGCVSFKDYSEFLKAFQRGDVDRLVVVPRLETRTSDGAQPRRDGADRYAANNRS
jgi:hypothetical protein